jgi:hypothetical protein
LPKAGAQEGADRRSAGINGETELERSRRRLQRTLRSQPDRPVSAGVDGPGLLGGQQRAATLSPELVIPASAVQDDEPQFQCTECDMIVKGSDPYCPFCGAIFADGPLSSEGTAEEAVEKPEVVRPAKFDVFELLNRRAKSKDMLYQEALRGFAGSARLLEEIEHLISDVSSLGTDTSRARRMIGSAWEACRDGDWNLVSTFARQTEELMAPSIPDLVRSELAKAREHLMVGKGAGVDVSGYLLRMKSAMRALHAKDPDEALRLTKELMDILREDSVSWAKGRSAASDNPFPSGE